MTELEPQDRRVDDRLRREGQAWRTTRSDCPDPDLLLARRSDVLDDTVREALSRHMAQCDACRRLAADVEALSLDDPDDEMEGRVRSALALPPPRRTFAWLAVAAAIIVTVGATFWWARLPRSSAEPPRVARTPPVVAPAPSSGIVALWTVQPPAVRIPLSGIGVSRSESTSESSQALVDALAGYTTGHYTESIAPLEALVRARPDAGEASFYLGVTYLLSDRPADAVPALERARELAAPGRTAEIDWYLATAEQRAGLTERARPRLRALCQASGDYRDRACAAQAALR